MKDWELKKVVAICTSVVMSIALIGFTVFTVTDSNNRHALEERKLQEETRKQQAVEALETKKVQAAASTREAEIKSKKRKIWERDAEGVDADTAVPAPGEPGWQPGKEGF